MTNNRSDQDLLRLLARHLRKHDVGCFDFDHDEEQERAEELITWFADSVDVLNLPPRTDVTSAPLASGAESVGPPAD